MEVTQAPGSISSVSATAPAHEITQHSTIELEAGLKYHLVCLETIKTDKFGNICRSIGCWAPDRILQELTLYLLEASPAKRRKERKSNESEKQESKISKRRARRAEYAKIQQMWVKNRSNCLRTLLRDKRTSNIPPKDVMTPFWENLMSTECQTTPGLTPFRKLL